MSVTVSIVSHGHGKLALSTLNQLKNYSNHISKVIFTKNIKENLNIFQNDYPFKVVVVENSKPLGFGANHNQAFRQCDSKFFCVINPDVGFQEDPFLILLPCFSDPSVAICAPIVVSPDGNKEDSARYFPTPATLFKKLLFKDKGIYPIDQSKIISNPPWIAGMFLLFSSEKYKNLSGFDEDYYLYYEDVDICARSWRKGYKIIVNNKIHIIHDARRSSHASVRFLVWHFKSILIFLWKHFGRLPVIKK